MSIARIRVRVVGVFAVLAASVATACGRGKPAATDTASGVPALGSAAPASASDGPTTKAPCPATGKWAECSAFDALDRAGLAPRRDSATGPVHLDPLTRPGERILLGGAELDLFIYPSESDRARDEARLDRHQYIEATDEPTLRGEPTLIRNVNLLVVLRSRNDHQRERVSDALSAGPPQPSHATQLPGSNAR